MEGDSDGGRGYHRRQASPDGHDQVLHGVSEGLGVGGQQLPSGRVFRVHGQALGRGQETAGRLDDVTTSLVVRER